MNNLTTNERLKETACWYCGHEYPIEREQCPHCAAANANIDPDKAYAQATGGTE